MEYTITKIEDKTFTSKAGKELSKRLVWCEELPDELIDSKYFTVWNNWKTAPWNEGMRVRIEKEMIRESEYQGKKQYMIDFSDKNTGTAILAERVATLEEELNKVKDAIRKRWGLEG